MGFLLHIITIAATSIPNILGYNLVFGKGKLFHFGPMAVSLAAAYPTFVVLNMTGSYLLGILAGFVFTMIVCAFLAWAAQRMEPDGFGVLTIALHLSLLAVVLNWREVTRGALGIPRIPRMPFLETPVAFTIAAVTVALLWVLCMWVLGRGAFGRRLAALGEHPWHAQAMGAQQARTHLIAFLISGVGALLTNILFTQYIAILHPTDFSFTFFIFMLVAIVTGKPGSVWGVTGSVVLFTFIREGIRFVPLSPGLVGPLRLIIFGVILLVAVWWRRDSLFPPQRSI